MIFNIRDVIIYGGISVLDGLGRMFLYTVGRVCLFFIDPVFLSTRRKECWVGGSFRLLSFCEIIGRICCCQVSRTSLLGFGVGCFGCMTDRRLWSVVFFGTECKYGYIFQGKSVSKESISFLSFVVRFY